MRDDRSEVIQFQGKKKFWTVFPQPLDLIQIHFLEGSGFLLHWNFNWITLNRILIELC